MTHVFWGGFWKMIVNCKQRMEGHEWHVFSRSQCSSIMTAIGHYSSPTPSNDDGAVLYTMMYVVFVLSSKTKLYKSQKILLLLTSRRVDESWRLSTTHIRVIDVTQEVVIRCWSNQKRSRRARENWKTLFFLLWRTNANWDAWKSKCERPRWSSSKNQNSSNFALLC